MKGTQLMDIYSILASKPHNTHHLNRYITFIQQCQQKNVGYEGMTENHHICPKANDLFPEYVDFQTYPWNKAVLTPRQHFIAHLILANVFKSDSMPQALFFMSNGNWKKHKKYSRLYEKLRIKLQPKWSKNGKKWGKATLGNTVVKDLDGNIHRVSVDDSRLKTGELVGVQKGTVTVKDKRGNTMNVSIDDPRYLSGELVGVAQGYVITKDIYGNVHRVEKKDLRYLSGELVSISTNMMPAKDTDGNTFWVSTNDTRVKTGELVSTTKGETVVKDKKGITYRVSVDDTRFATGELVGAQKNTVAVRDKNGNKFRVHKDDSRYISGELVGVSKGMESRNKNKICYTDGNRNIYLASNEMPPRGFYKGNINVGKTYDKTICCPHCGVFGGSVGNMNRWHFDNCKSLKITQQIG
jgi:hypothetical protein